MYKAQQDELTFDGAIVTWQMHGFLLPSLLCLILFLCVFSSLHLWYIKKQVLTDVCMLVNQNMDEI